MLKARIEVTREDIARGANMCRNLQNRKTQCCPIALAMWRRWPEAKCVRAAGIMGLTTGDRSFTGTAPQAASIFMGAFDRGEPVAPCSIDLELEEVEVEEEDDD